MLLSPGFNIPSKAPLGNILMIEHLLLLHVPRPGWLQDNSTGKLAAVHSSSPLEQSLLLLLLKSLCYVHGLCYCL